ncbi:uncharacterized protein I303_107659 [Kwoniella dejecticola CBS 10117]|uniref:YCII-related domain-containing protein n=1 Tax=Kwoniella dejecticola CBS 10117 TaxID=1296121 RepID=A0A1A5ZVC3_9TREE|nr:uncharacterized protein I303_07669 [Kwoniella dejecticola CBS 10117]OBR81759.1 hypothetical protein I303_07669 [Kwoniella dejecticola CBS 10117]
MPRFLVYAPDYPDHLAQRLAVRPEHLERSAKDPKGLMVYSGPIAPRPGTKQHATPPPPGQLNLAGSFMVYQMNSLEEVWARLKEDVYWRKDVWDKERLIVEELIDV